MSVFDGELSSREIRRKLRTDITYMYLAAMEKLLYWTLIRLKVEYSDFVDKSFKTTIIAKDNDLIKIHHMDLDGSKIKAKISINI